MRWLSLAVVIMMLLASQATAAAFAAQVASPVARPDGLLVPDPEACQIEPRELDFFAQLPSTPVAGTPSVSPRSVDPVETRFSPPDASPRPLVLPPAEPADLATVAAVTGVMREALACRNAGDLLRYTALLSDDLLLAIAAERPLPDVQRLPAVPQPLPPEQRLGYAAVLDARVLADGRVALLVETDDPTEPPFGRGTDLLIFVDEGDGWLIDGLLEHVTVSADAAPATSGTPAAVSHGGPVTDHVSFVDALRGRGITVSIGGEIQQPFLYPESGTLLLLDGPGLAGQAEVQSFEYADPAAATADASQIEPDGNLRTVMITWIAPPHFFRRERLIVLYVGEDPAVVALLTDLLGPQFAGQ